MESDEPITLKEKFAKIWANPLYRRLITFALIVIAYIILINMLTFFTLRSRNPHVNYLRHFVIMVQNAANLILVSVGLTMVTRVRKFANFAHSELVILGIYVAITIDEYAADNNLPEDYALRFLFAKMVLAFLITGFFAILMEVIVFGPLVKRNATPLSLMVASIGIGMVVRQTIQEIYGAVPITSRMIFPPRFDEIGTSLLEKADTPVIGGIYKFFSIFFNDRTAYDVRGIEVVIARTEAWSVLVMIIAVVGMKLIFTKTTLGISMRATADDPDLAQITGINTQRVIYMTWFIAGGVTGVGALFLFSVAQIQPGSGFAQLLLIFAVVTLGGFDSFEGTLISAFIISTSMTAVVLLNGKAKFLENNYEFWDPIVFWSTTGDWKLVFPFFIIVVVLFIRPRGIFGLIDPKSKL